MGKYNLVIIFQNPLNTLDCYSRIFSSYTCLLCGHPIMSIIFNLCAYSLKPEIKTKLFIIGNFATGSNGTILRIGSLCSLDFCKDSVFICTSISRNKDLFKFKFLLCSVVEKKVQSIDRGVSCTVNDVKHVSCQCDVVIGSKGKGLVDKII